MSEIILRLDTNAFAYPDVPLPKVVTVRQKSDAPVLDDIEQETRQALDVIGTDSRLKPGASVAVGVGSRGINNLVTIVRTVIGTLKERGMHPFIVPAMGSHGGATAEGQEAILRDYGITPEAVGAPLRATMEAAQVATLDDGYPIYFDCHALAADAVVVVNRIKPHTDFTGQIESGLAKMCAIGLGKRKGAESIHRFGADGLSNIMPRIACKLVETVNIVGGVGVIENCFGQTAEIHGLRSQEIGQERERQLLIQARRLSPRLAFTGVDILIVDEMGKDISGSGMDPYVIGRVRMPSLEESQWPAPGVRVVCVLDLTHRSHGNATGLGLADFTTRRLIEKTDFTVTSTNLRTSGEGGAMRGKIPWILEDAESCVRAAIGSCGRGDWDSIRLVRIRNTEFVDTMEISEALLEEAQTRPDIEVLEDRHRLDFKRGFFSGEG